MFDPEDVAHVAKTIQIGLVTMVGGILGHVVDVVLNGREWSLKGHIAIALVAFLVGQFIGEVLPAWVAGKYGVLMMLGTISAPMYKRIQTWLASKIDQQLK